MHYSTFLTKSLQLRVRQCEDKRRETELTKGSHGSQTRPTFHKQSANRQMWELKFLEPSSASLRSSQLRGGVQDKWWAHPLAFSFTGFFGLAAHCPVKRVKASVNQSEESGDVWMDVSVLNINNLCSRAPTQRRAKASLIHAGFSHFERLQRHLLE